METMPKLWSRLQEVDVDGREVRFLPEGRDNSVTLPVTEDAQVHARGFFGSLQDFVPGQRVWVWVDFNREKQWTGVRVLADELSAHLLHGSGGVVKEIDEPGGFLMVKPPRGDLFELKIRSETRIQSGDQEGNLGRIPAGAKVFYQQIWMEDGYVASLVLDEEALGLVREESRKRAEERWLAQGFRGNVTWTHRAKGEARVLLEAPAMRWARALWRGDKVGVATGTEAAVKTTVVSVQPLHEKTELHLIIEGVDQETLVLGQPVRVRIDRPELPDDETPPDPGRLSDRQARLNWILSSTYCTCGNAGDVCAGHFYTLASCNNFTCAMPSQTRKSVGKMIDEGLSDAEILERLRKERGPLLFRQHIEP